MSKRVNPMGLVAPCKDCPFRTDVDRYLAPRRYLELAHHLVDHRQGFTCHKHNDHDENGEALLGDRSMACAGAMIWLEHQGKPNQVMQVMERLGHWDPKTLRMDSPVYRTRRGFETGQE